MDLRFVDGGGLMAFGLDSRHESYFLLPQYVASNSWLLIFFCERRRQNPASLRAWANRRLPSVSMISPCPTIIRSKSHVIRASTDRRKAGRSLIAIRNGLDMPGWCWEPTAQSTKKRVQPEVSGPKLKSRSPTIKEREGW